MLFYKRDIIDDANLFDNNCKNCLLFDKSICCFNLGVIANTPIAYYKDLPFNLFGY